ncbi:hypothetical protein RUM43_003539 [Polyplax serrata]|uniref:Uncharacterized protein n=1 Tax=Polyplax serrata TaxID=468196 RepID=A0AAN8S9E8_POLSC
MNLMWLSLLVATQIVATLQAPDATFEGKRPKNTLWSSTWTDKLKQDLLLHYDKFARPLDAGNKTILSLDVMIRHIELDEKRSTMVIHCWLKMRWNDGKLRWNITDYNDLKELHLAEHEIWQPDIVPYNTASGSTLDYYGNTNLICYWNGSVLWVPPTIFRVFCEFDFTRWPFDTQICSLKIGSWTYSGEQIDFVTDNLGTVTEIPDLVPNPEWTIHKVTSERNVVYYPCCPDPYTDITYYLTIERHSATYKALIITPTCAVVLIILASFWLPAWSENKIILSGTAVIIVCMFLVYFMYTMPAMAGNTPYIVSFYSTCLYFASVAVVLGVLVINLAKCPKISPLPWTLKKNLTGCLGKCLLLEIEDKESFSKEEEMGETHAVLPEQTGKQLSEAEATTHQRDWVLLATALDRMFFLVYCVAFTLLALIYCV